MENIRHSIEILFKKRNPETIIQEHFGMRSVEDFDSNLFASVYSDERPHLYTKDEISNVSNLLESKWKKLEYVEVDNIFNVLVNFTKEVLTEEKGEPICKFEKLLKWRELSYEVGEDLLTTSYFAYKDYVQSYDRSIFAWKPIIGSNNSKLKNMLSSGIAENHFHLKGSSPHFQLTWISLMNNIVGRDREFGRLEKELMLEPDKKYSFGERLLSMRSLVKKAAYIRYEMYSLINSIPLKDSGGMKKVDVDLLKAISDSEINFYLLDLQSEINYLKHEYGKKYGGEVPDYAIPKSISDNNYNHENCEYNGSILLYGERHLLYSFLKKVYSGDKKINEYRSLFHAYLIIKEKLRSEIVQVNNRVGFANFSNYQNRKGGFLTGIYKEAVVNTAINTTKYDQSIVALEARIAPSNTASEMKKEIKKLDASVASRRFMDIKRDPLLELESKIKSEECQKDKSHFYVAHFIKESENYQIYKKNEKNIKLCGYVKPLNYKTRKNVEKQAKAIAQLRESSSETKHRLYGIDAANFEVGCRPETFAQGYRYLRNSHVKNEFETLGGKENFNLGITQHAGEDYLDIVDGLRAIDETIRFLNYEQGDRLGHALALGIAPKKYYKSKKMSLIKTKQVHLDDVVWCLAKLREYGLSVSQKVVSELESDFYRLYHEIFGEALQEKQERSCSYHSYYSAWKLRGDNPQYYINGEYFSKGGVTFWEKSGIDDSRSHELNVVRENKLCCEIYREYHYNPEVRKKGLESDVVKVSIEYIDLVEKLQKGLQREVAKKNICIESNPTSNYVISSFKRYSEHPIKNFFNLGLTMDNEKVSECPQISVSINTDDQGVFPTCLENEYALMALALEKEKDEDGNPKYQPTMVYEWLEKVRKMGLEQSFKLRKGKL